MIEDFSSGYYRMHMRVEEYDDGPIIDKDLYNFINHHVYEDSTAPVMMRVGLDAGETYTVGAEAGVPSDVLAVPKENAPGEKDVFVLKSRYANMVSGYHG